MSSFSNIVEVDASNSLIRRRPIHNRLFAVSDVYTNSLSSSVISTKLPSIHATNNYSTVQENLTDAFDPLSVTQANGYLPILNPVSQSDSICINEVDMNWHKVERRQRHRNRLSQLNNVPVVSFIICISF